MKTFPVATSHIQFKRTMHLIQSCATVVLALALEQVQAQVFIPSTYERDALNALIPGIVNGAGVMDTLNPGIAQLDTAEVSCIFGGSGGVDTVEFIGFRHLASLHYLSLNIHVNGTFTSFSLNGLPSGLESLSVMADLGTNPNPQLHLNTLPAALQNLLVSAPPNWPYATFITTMPDSMKFVTIYGSMAHWNGTPLIKHLEFSFEGANDFVFPSAVIDTLGIYDNAWSNATLDLSQVIANRANVISGVQGLTSHITAWPAGLSSLLVDGTMWFTQQLCLPPFPDGLSDLTIVYYHPFCMPNWPASLTNCHINNSEVGPTDVVYCSVLNTSCPGANPGISGRVFMDTNGNGQLDAGEPPLPQASVLVQPNSYVVGCEPDGTWEVGVLPGNYTIVPCSTYPYYQSFTPTSHVVNLPAMGDVDTNNNFAVTLIPDIQDLQAHLSSSPARPGFNNRLYLSCRNYGTVPMDAQLVLNYDAVQSWVGSSLVPSSISGNMASWNLGSLAIGETRQLTVDLFTNASVTLGTPITHQLNALPDSTDETPYNNVAMVIDSVVGSYDPNDKLLSPAMMTPAELQTGAKPITYTIRFQNTGTYLAQRVVIVDTLPNGLQTASIQVLASSHAQRWYVDHGVLYVIFQGINLPDSTSDALNSQGFVRFSILPETDLPLGATITNIAHIVFDFNAPIITPPAVFHVDDASAVAERSWTGIRVYPNPVLDQLWVMHGTNNGMAAQYAIKDLSGRDVLNGKLGGDGAVNVGHLRAGSYTITTTGKTGVFTTRFMKL